MDSESARKSVVDRGTRLPRRRIPRLYYLAAYAGLGSAFALIAADPAAIAGFYYHPKMIAVVHLVTLGWISCSILGSLYLIGPLTLGGALPHRRLDDVILALLVVGTLGMVSHFWIDEPSGMAWSAGTALAGVGLAAWRLPRLLAHARLPAAVRLHFHLAFFNLLVAAALGVLIGIDKNLHLVPGNALARVHAHAHLAAAGWATMMVMGAVYGLLPLVLPAAAPRGGRIAAGALLFELGTLGLAAGFIFDQTILLRAAALAASAGVGVFLLQVRWMARQPRSPDTGEPPSDLGVLQVKLALGCLAATAVCGLVLAWVPPAAWTPDLAMAYGALALVGFLAQIVAGTGARLLPLAIRTWSPLAGPHAQPSLGLEELGGPRLRRALFLCWFSGVPALIAGLALTVLPLLRLGAATLLVAVAGGALELLLMERRARRAVAAASAAQGDEV